MHSHYEKGLSCPGEGVGTRAPVQLPVETLVQSLPDPGRSSDWDGGPRAPLNLGELGPRV